MVPGVFVLSRDRVLVEQMRASLPEQCELIVAESLESAQLRLKSASVRAAVAHVCPATLNGHSAQTLLSELQRAASAAPVFGVVDADCTAAVREVVARGTQECFALPADLTRLEQRLEQVQAVVFDPMGYCAGLPYRALHGQTRSLVTFTPAMFSMFDELKVAAAHDVTILLIGETGCGKTHLARLIHELSPRYRQRCLTVACGALPPDLIESELFGYVKGAFTGADTDKPGKFAAAARGTLLLDEIDVLTPEQQAKLLRVIETGEYEPVGSNDTQTSSARLIVASNIDLEQLVQSHRFRMDMFYRLNTLSFHLPPLRERPWDIEYLARKFAHDHGQTHHIELNEIEPEFLRALREYRWPGNIRELENVIRRAVLYCSNGVLTLNDLPSTLRPVRPESGSNGHAAPHGKPMTLDQRIEQVERHILEESLERHNQHRTDTARELGISRVTLYNKMRKFGMLASSP